MSLIVSKKGLFLYFSVNVYFTTKFFYYRICKDKNNF